MTSHTVGPAFATTLILLAAGCWPMGAACAEPAARPIGGNSAMLIHVADAAVEESPAVQQAPPAAQEELGRIRIEYVPPKKPAHQKTYQEVKNRRVLERVQEIFSPFRLSEDLYIKALDCDGKPNTYFDREEDRPTVKICYEYLKAIYDRMPKKPTAAGLTPREVLVGQFVFAAAHELGHALFDVYNIPIFGRQEDAADQFATYFILQFGGERARRLILGAAYAYRRFVKQLDGNPKVTLPLAAFSSDHGQPEQRFYNLVCIAYGYDAKLFAAAVDKKWLRSTRAKVCNLEYQNLRYAVKTLVNPHVDETLAQKVINTGFAPSPDPPQPAKSAPRSAK
jgi:Putative metallopeptidase